MTLFLSALLFLIAQASAGETLVIDSQDISQKPLKPYLSQWIGPQQPLPRMAEDLHFFSLWTPVDQTKYPPSWQQQPLQFKLNLANPVNRPRELLLAYTEPLVDSMQVLVVIDEQIVQRYQTGNQYHFDSRPIRHRHLLFPVTLPANNDASVLIEIDGRLDQLHQQLVLWDRTAFFERSDHSLMLKSIYYGVLLVFTIYSFLLFFAVRESFYLWFALFCVSLLLRSMTTGNVFFEFLWPQLPQLQNAVIVSSLVATSALMAMFAVDFLNIRHYSPRFYRVFYLYIFLHAPVLLYQAWHHWAIQLISVWLLSAWAFSFVILGSALWVYKKGHRPAAWFFSAYLIMVALSFFSAGSHFYGWNVPFIASGELGELIFVVAMAIALTLHISKTRERAHLNYARSKAKSDFMAKMSHEIRTPINGVLGMAQLLAETPLSRKQRHYADVINHCSKTLLNIINDILEYAKIEAGKLEMENAPFDLDALLLKNNELFWPQIKAKNLHYHFRPDPAISPRLIGDAARLQQIFNNLFSNAIKFTDNGYIDFSSRLLKREDGQVTVQFCISDSGIGISEEELSRIFVPFAQASSSTNRIYGGSGLGLNITHQLVQLMGGSMKVDSRPGSGSTFYLDIPFAIDEHGNAEWQARINPLKNKKALLLSNRRDVIYYLLQTWQIRTDRVDSPGEMFEHLKRHNNDIVILHAARIANLSPQDKLQLREFLPRALVYDDSYHPVRRTLPGFESASLIESPFSFNQFCHQIYQLLAISDDRPAEHAPAGRNKGDSLSHLKLLVAEDDATNRLVIRAILKKLHIQHDIVTNGKQALERYSASPESYNAILMDCEMPEMDGYAATREIRAFEKQQQQKAVPVIALTAHVLQEYEQRCYASGMDHVIAKPIDIAILTEALQQFTGVSN